MGIAIFVWNLMLGVGVEGLPDDQCSAEKGRIELYSFQFIGKQVLDRSSFLPWHGGNLYT